MFTVIEEFLALDISWLRYHGGAGLETFVTDWNASRKEGRQNIDIEIGKPNMRRLTRMYLELTHAQTQVDYDSRILRVSVGHLFDEAGQLRLPALPT